MKFTSAFSLLAALALNSVFLVSAQRPPHGKYSLKGRGEGLDVESDILSARYYDELDELVARDLMDAVEEVLYQRQLGTAAIMGAVGLGKGSLAGKVVGAMQQGSKPPPQTGLNSPFRAGGQQAPSQPKVLPKIPSFPKMEPIKVPAGFGQKPAGGSKILQALGKQG